MNHFTHLLAITAVRERKSCQVHPSDSAPPNRGLISPTE